MRLDIGGEALGGFIQRWGGGRGGRGGGGVTLLNFRLQ